MNYWLEHCRPPRERPENLTWDVFISYRSIDRRWAIALHDMLSQAGYEVFLDQYVLVPGKELDIQLGENLNASASGVLVWSTRAADSTWVKGEYSSMAARYRDCHSSFPFHFVVAVLDGHKPPGLSGGHLFLDFSEYPDGPMGADLVRLTCALSGFPLPAAAVSRISEFEQNLHEMTRRVRTLGNIGNHKELYDLVTSDDPVFTTSATLPGLAIEQMIAGAHYDHALRALTTAMGRFPRSMRLRQLRGLALRRSGKLEEARECMDQLYQDSARDTETLGIYAAVEADRWEQLNQEGREREARDALEHSRSLYKQAFEMEPTDYYTGINAASKSALLKEFPLARKLADQVLKVLDDVEQKRNISNNEYWEQATRAEALLLKGDHEQAVKQFHEARIAHAEKKGSIATTGTQVRRLLCVLDVPEPSRRLLLEEFDIDASAIQ